VSIRGRLTPTTALGIVYTHLKRVGAIRIINVTNRKNSNISNTSLGLAILYRVGCETTTTARGKISTNNLNSTTLGSTLALGQYASHPSAAMISRDGFLPSSPAARRWLGVAIIAVLVSAIYLIYSSASDNSPSHVSELNYRGLGDYSIAEKTDEGTSLPPYRNYGSTPHRRHRTHFVIIQGRRNAISRRWICTGG